MDEDGLIGGLTRAVGPSRPADFAYVALAGPLGEGAANRRPDVIARRGG